MDPNNLDFWGQFGDRFGPKTDQKWKPNSYQQFDEILQCFTNTISLAKKHSSWVTVLLAHVLLNPKTDPKNGLQIIENWVKQWADFWTWFF